MMTPETMLLFMEAMRAGVTGVLGAVLLYMFCHKGQYNWRDFGIVGALFTSILFRYSIGYAPVSHIIGVTLLNLIFVWVAGMVWARPSKIPPIERKGHCFGVTSE